MALYGLIGYPLSHSFSGTYFNRKFQDAKLSGNKYRLFPLPDISDFPNLLADQPELAGLNVTIPHKITVLQFLHEVDKEAAGIGAVNCIGISDEGKYLTGFNTDIYGFRESLKPLLRSQHKRALVLGTGGASKAITQALKQLGIEYISVSRTPSGENQLAYPDLTEEIISQHTLIINTTPLGTYPETSACPALPYLFIGKDHLLFDLVYNPAETLFLKQGKLQGAAIKNGLEMLQLQAERSWEIWKCCSYRQKEAGKYGPGYLMFEGMRV
jgi:shikimate dehydrogenase